MTTATTPPPPALTRERFVDDTLRWIRRRFRPAMPVGPDTGLFEGLVDSVRILELIAWTEMQTGERIPDAMIRMDHFRTVARIAEAFVREPAR